MFIRYRYKIGGGHTHIRMFAGKSKDMTLAKCGEFCLTNDEFGEFRAYNDSSYASFCTVEFVNDGEGELYLENLPYKELEYKEFIKTEQAGFGKDEIV